MIYSLEDTAYIALCDLLKATGIAPSGGQAKAWIAEGLVWRNGEVETRKTAKIRAGETIQFADQTIAVSSAKSESQPSF